MIFIKKKIIEMNNYENDQLYEDLIELIDAVESADNWKRADKLRKGIKIIEDRHNTALTQAEYDFINGELNDEPEDDEN